MRERAYHSPEFISCECVSDEHTCSALPSRLLKVCAWDVRERACVPVFDMPLLERERERWARARRERERDGRVEEPVSEG